MIKQLLPFVEGVFNPKKKRYGSYDSDSDFNSD